MGRQAGGGSVPVFLLSYNCYRQSIVVFVLLYTISSFLLCVFLGVVTKYRQALHCRNIDLLTRIRSENKYEHQELVPWATSPSHKPADSLTHSPISHNRMADTANPTSTPTLTPPPHPPASNCKTSTPSQLSSAHPKSPASSPNFPTAAATPSTRRKPSPPQKL